MSDNSSIEWTDATLNVVTGCADVSPGCRNCYARTFAERWRGIEGHYFENGFDLQLRPERLKLPLSWRRPRKVFVNSMSDLFHDGVPDSLIVDLFAVMALTPQHTYQVLTKRHARMRSLLRQPGFWTRVGRQARHIGFNDSNAADRFTDGRDIYDASVWERLDFLPNVWLGCSVEDQKWADIRVPALVETPAAVRFLSCEPLLGPVDLTPWMPDGHASWRCQDCRRFYAGPLQRNCPDCGSEGFWTGSHSGNGRPNGQPLGWVIVGGESGRGARPMSPDWARSLRDQCAAAQVPYLFKQWGEYQPTGYMAIGARDKGCVFVGEPLDDLGHRWEMQRVGKGKAGRELDGRTHDEYPAVAR